MYNSHGRLDRISTTALNLLVIFSLAFPGFTRLPNTKTAEVRVEIQQPSSLPFEPVRRPEFARPQAKKGIIPPKASEEGIGLY